MKRLSVLAVAMLLGAVVALPAAAASRTHVAHLTGANEVPAVDSGGQGQAIFKLSKDGTEISYKLIATNIDDVTQAHIHLAPAGVNGPVVAFLFGFAAEGVDPHGVLAEGVITSADLLGPLAGMTLADLVEAMEAGNTYVNVHTIEHPPGEIRGQIR